MELLSLVCLTKACFLIFTDLQAHKIGLFRISFPRKSTFVGLTIIKFTKNTNRRIYLKIKSFNSYIIISIFSFAISSFSFLLIPLSSFHGTKLQLIFAYAVGTLFWSGLILGLIFIVLLSNQRKKDGFKKYKLLGIFNFFKNAKAKVFDVLMIFNVIMLIISSRLLGMHHNLSVIFLSLTCFSFYMHSIFNGNNYAYVNKKGVKE